MSPVPHCAPAFLFAAELRPPALRAGGPRGGTAWIDTYPAVRRLRPWTSCSLTEPAPSAPLERDNLRPLYHLGLDVPPRESSPFLTDEACDSSHAGRTQAAPSSGIPALGVLGGHKRGRARRGRSNMRALRAMLRTATTTLALGRANPHADRAAGGLPRRGHSHADSTSRSGQPHHATGFPPAVTSAAEQRGLTLPGLFASFYYRTPNPRTLDALQGFLHVPSRALTASSAKARPPKTAARRRFGRFDGQARASFLHHNLPVRRAHRWLLTILAKWEGRHEHHRSGMDAPGSRGSGDSRSVLVVCSAAVRISSRRPRSGLDASNPSHDPQHQPRRWESGT